jgi:hypothetical protein
VERKTGKRVAKLVGHTGPIQDAEFSAADASS